MITVSMAGVIDAGRDRVWRALTCPDELLAWNRRLVGPAARIERAQGPAATRWRYRLGSVPVELRITPLELVAESRFRAAVALGLFRFEATCSLAEAPEAPRRTQLSLRLASSNAVPVVGGELDRFDVRKLASELVDETLRWLRAHCEAAEAPAATAGAQAGRVRCAAPPAPSARGPRSAGA